MSTFFSDFFKVDQNSLDDHGAFNISLVNDLPLFIDPFLLFNSEESEYRKLHDGIIDYLVFLKDKAASGPVVDDLLRLWYCFPEVKQNWLGFSIAGNEGSGLGIDFARALHANLHRVFADFGNEKITEGSHLEKVCLISDGVGRDNISDFTTNLIVDYLCRYTEVFALEHLEKANIRDVAISKARFNYDTELWQRKQYKLPWIGGDHVILTPKDMLTRDENWINRGDLINNFEQIPVSIPDAQLRAQVNNYFNSVLARPKDREPNKKERGDAAISTVLNFPQLIDYYIRLKEQKGDEAVDLSSEKVIATEYMYVDQLKLLQRTLASQSNFYKASGNTYDEAHERLAYLKDVIENKGGYRIFYYDGKPLEREKDLQIIYRLVWFGTPSDVSTEANDGRGPVDFKISRGAPDKTLVEMKLAKNNKLERNLERQVPIYQAASDTKKAIKAILFFTKSEEERALGILDRLGVLGHPDIVLIDARSDNKPSGSVA
jgi:hypothetical protein